MVRLHEEAEKNNLCLSSLLLRVEEDIATDASSGMKQAWRTTLFLASVIFTFSLFFTYLLHFLAQFFDLFDYLLIFGAWEERGRGP